MSDTTMRDIIREAFIKPIRTVLVVDDEFPTYDALGANTDTKTTDSTDAKPDQTKAESITNVRLDVSRAVSLWNAFRQFGWNCDIDDGRGLSAADNRFGEADLVVIDYELAPSNPGQTIELLKSLAHSEHASLAVVYTKSPRLDQARLLVATQLRGAVPNRPLFDTLSEDLRVELDAVADRIDPDTILAHLRRESAMQSIFGKEVIKICQGKVLPAGVRCNEVVANELEEHLHATYGATLSQQAVPHPFEIDRNADANKPLWVWCNNLFVAFVSKGNSDTLAEGRRLVDELERAIGDWNPDGLTTTLAFARGEIARSGFRIPADLLKNRMLSAALLYFADKGSEVERKERLLQLYRRLLSSYAEHVLTTVSEFGAKAISWPIREGGAGVPFDSVNWALSTARQPESQQKDLLHELNTFLVTEPPHSHARLGTIFMVVDGVNSEFWLCVTPACDMALRTPKERQWGGRIQPLRPIFCLRGGKRTDLDGQLSAASHGRCVFLKSPTRAGAPERWAIAFPDGESVELEQFFLEDQGAINANGKIRAKRLRGNGLGEVDMQPVELAVIGQLRELYANRFLRVAGDHLSRIGVDFVDSPMAAPKA